MIKFLGNLSEECKYYYLKDVQKLNFFICFASFYRRHFNYGDNNLLVRSDIAYTDNISYRNRFFVAEIET